MRRPTRIPDPGQMVDLQMEEGSWRQGFRALSAPSTAEMGEVLIWVCTEDEYGEAAKLGILGASLIAGAVGWTILRGASRPR